MKYLGLWSSGLRKFFEKFLKPSGLDSYMCNVHSLIAFDILVNVTLKYSGTEILRQLRRK